MPPTCQSINAQKKNLKYQTPEAPPDDEMAVTRSMKGSMRLQWLKGKKYVTHIPKTTSKITKKMTMNRVSSCCHAKRTRFAAGARPFSRWWTLRRWPLNHWWSPRFSYLRRPGFSPPSRPREVIHRFLLGQYQHRAALVLTKPRDPRRTQSTTIHLVMDPFSRVKTLPLLPRGIIL